jgi:hypothetical protein
MNNDLIADLIAESLLVKHIAYLSLALTVFNVFAVIFIFHQMVKT